MPSIDSLFPSNYLKAADLEGEEVFTIKDIKIEEIGQVEQRKEKPVLYFEEDERGLVLNQTNAAIIADLYGEDYTMWAGNAIILRKERVPFQGKMVDAIRVKLEKPGAPKKAPKSGGKGDAPFDNGDSAFAGGKVPNQAYGLKTLPWPVDVTQDQATTLADLAKEVKVLKGDTAEAVTIRDMLKRAKAHCEFRQIAYSNTYQPQTIGEAVDFLYTLVATCEDNDRALAKQQPV